MISLPSGLYRRVSVPIAIQDAELGTLELATALDQDYYGRRVLGKAVAKATTTIREANATLPAGAAQAAELPTATTSHDLRHHFASVLLASGQSVVAVAELLGHENATLVLTTYGHLLPDSEDRTRRAVDAAWTTPDETATAQGRPR